MTYTGRYDIEAFKDFTLKMRVKFLFSEIARQLSMQSIDLLFREDPLLDIDLNIKSKKEGNDILDFFYGAGREKVNLYKYYSGERLLRFQGVNDSRQGVGDTLNSIFPNSKQVFISGPSKLFDILNSETPQESFLFFIQAAREFLQRSQYVHEHEIPELNDKEFNEELGLVVCTGKKIGGHTVHTTWNDISSNILSNDAKSNYEEIRCFLPPASDCADFDDSPLKVNLWLLHIVDAFIQVKYLGNTGAICNKLIIYSDILLKIEKYCQINRVWWFVNPIFEQERIRLLRTKEPLYFEQYKFDAFDFEDD